MQKRNISRATTSFRIYLLLCIIQAYSAYSSSGAAAEAGTAAANSGGAVAEGGTVAPHSGGAVAEGGTAAPHSCGSAAEAGTAVKRKLRLLEADPVGHSGCG